MIDTSQYQYQYNYEPQFHKIITKPLTNLSQTPENKHQLTYLKTLLTKRLQLETDYKRQYKSIQHKYNNTFKGNFLNRNNIISTIPHFWLQCIENSCQFKVFLNDKDKAVLCYLITITCDVEDNGDYQLSFGFQPNDYFEEKTLTVRYLYDRNTLNIKEVIGSEIHWKKGKNVMVKGGLSFFGIFKSCKDGDEDIHDAEDLGCHVKEDLIPNAIEFYLDLISGGGNKDGEESYDDYDDEDDH